MPLLRFLGGGIGYTPPMPVGDDQARLCRERVLFVSDVHLTPAVPEVFLLFCRFLTREARGAKALYLLGDVFDFWIGR